MAQLLAFTVEIKGRDVAISTLTELNNAAIRINRELAKAKFGSPAFDASVKKLALLRAELDKYLKQQRETTKNQIESNTIVSTSFKELEAKLAVLRNKYKDFTAEERKSPIGKETIKEIRQLDKELTGIAAKLGNYKGSLSAIVKSQGGQIAGAVGGILTQSLGSQGGIAESLITGVGGGLISAVTGNLALGVAQMGGAFLEAGAKAVSFNAEVSDALANVRKTTNLTQSEVDKLGESLKGLDTRTSLINLLKIGEALGQLGLEVSTNSIAAIDKLNVALGDEFAGNTQDIVDNVGKLRNVFNDLKTNDQATDFLKIGNALNYLGATGLATAPIISDFSVRIAGTLGPLGIAAKDILGVSATLQELGTNAERGASGFARSVAQLTRTPELFVKELKLSGDVIEKLTNGQYKSLTEFIQKDLIGAYKLVLNRLKEMNLSNIGLSKTLDAVKISGVGEVEVIGKLLQNMTLYEQRTNDAASALGNISSITSEFEKKNQTLGAELEKLGNNIAELFVNSETSQGIASLVGSFNELFLSIKGVSEVLGDNYEANTRAIISILNLDKADQKRVSTIKELQVLYPELIGNLTTEQVTNEKLYQVLGRINYAYQNRVKSIREYNTFTKAQEVQTDRASQAKSFEAIVLNQLVEEYKKYGNAIGVSNLAGGSVISQARKVKDALDAQGKSTKDLTYLIQRYDNFTGKVVDSEQKLAEARKGANKALAFTNPELFEGTLRLKDQLDVQLNKNKAAQKEVDILVRKGKLSEAQIIVDRRAQQVKETLSGLDTANFRDAKGAFGLDPEKYAKQAEEIAAKLRESQNLLDKSTGTIDGESSAGKVARAVQVSRKGFNKVLESEDEYYKERLKLLSNAAAERLKASTAINADITAKEIAAENERFASEARSFKENIDKRQELETKELAKLENFLAEIREAKKRATKGSDRATLVAQEKEVLEQIARLKKQAAEDLTTFGEDFNRSQELNQQIHNKNLEDIEKRAQERALKALDEYQDKYFSLLEAARAKQFVGIEEEFAKRDALIEQNRQDQIIKAKKALSGVQLDAKLTQIDFDFDIQDLESKKRRLEDKLLSLKAELELAINSNKASDLLGSFFGISTQSPVADANLDKLKKLIAETEVQITNINQAEGNRSADFDQQNLDKRLARQKRYRNELLELVLNSAKSFADAEYERESANLERLTEARKSAIDEEYEYRKKNAKNNAIELERLEKEKAAKIRKIDEDRFEQQKELDIKRARIDAALAIIKAYASLDPISATIAAAGIALTTAIQIDRIKSQKLAVGGFTGRSKHRRDSTGERPVDATVHEGEFVVRRKVVTDPVGRRLVNALDLMNQGVKINHAKYFAEGGFISKVQSIGQTTNNIVVQTVLSDDSIDRLAIRLARGVEEGATNGVKKGLKDKNRIDERENALTNRINL